jgi:DNA-binding XRE family transcriptional regulator
MKLKIEKKELRKLIYEQNKNYKMFMESISMKQGTIYRVINGYGTTWKTAVKISNKLNKEISDIFKPV